MKIFKYEVIDGQATIPKDITIIRVDYVDDGFYKGRFVWGIVDEKQTFPEHSTCSFILQSNSAIDSRYLSFLAQNQYHYGTTCNYGRTTQLSVKEKQYIHLSGKPIRAYDKDGKLYVDSDTVNEGQYKIVMYKTGQLITEPIESLRYIGLCKLWIMQELGLYTFVVEG